MVDLIDPEIKALYDLAKDVRRFTKEWDQTGTPTRTSIRKLKAKLAATDPIFETMKKVREARLRRIEEVLGHMEEAIADYRRREP
jgi:tRNA A37 N6-isopentenylltransferase MiaA